MSGRRVMALMGLPGSGKSALLRRVARRLALPVVDRDAIRAAMFPQSQGDPAEKEAANQAVLTAVALHLAQGRDCAVDGMTFASPALRERLAHTAAQGGGTVRWVWMDAPLRLAVSRVAANAGRHVARERTPELVREVAARFAPVPDGTLRLDATRPPGALANEVERDWSGPAGGSDPG
jgi:predicted kinase